MIRILLIHEDNLLRLGIYRALESTPDIRIIGETSIDKEGLLFSQQLTPDAVILSSQLSNTHNPPLASALSGLNPAPKILVIGSNSQQSSSNLTAHATSEQLLSAIKMVMSGENFINQEAASPVKSTDSMDSSTDPEHQLSPSEIKILKLFAEGKNFAEIANLLSISYKSVHYYKEKIAKKMNVHNDIQLALVAMKKGIIS